MQHTTPQHATSTIYIHNTTRPMTGRKERKREREQEVSYMTVRIFLE
jgi:hypothetical protein